jgi:GTP-binding protein HflX
LFERPRSGERAILVHVKLSNVAEQAELAEFTELAKSAGAQVLCAITGQRPAPDPAYFVGTGKLEEIREAVARENAELILFNHELSPGQERNLERALECRVLDRVGLILDIFAQRARSFEGKLQVELAQLQHLSSRLVRGWTHLERQRGGIGLRGPGETQLETDRRLLGERIKQIHRRLEKVGKQREQSRRARQRAELPGVSLVGYTNAGKSTLFNRLTASGVYVADQLFATLDPTVRRIALPNKAPLILADTVGFIQQLPHDLVAAFRSTLEETVRAHLLLHVVDAHDPERLQRIAQVNEVLGEIHAGDVAQILIYNKLDLLPEESPRVEIFDDGPVLAKVWLSAVSGAGVDLLLNLLAEHFARDLRRYDLCLPARAGQAPDSTQGKLRAELHRLGTVWREQFEDNGDCLMEVSLEAHLYARLRHAYPEITELALGPEAATDERGQ